jgi:hypothetical protein
MSEIELETEFEKIHLEEGPCKFKDDASAVKCDCKKSSVKPLEHSNTGSNLKVKDRRKNLIKPARLKIIGTSWARQSRNSTDEVVENETQKAGDDLEAFASDSFLKMRISPREVLTHSPTSEEKDERTSPASSSTTPNSCSAQAKLQQQFSSSSEFDATISEMSEFFAYHLGLHPQDKNFLVDSMYT